MFVGMARISLVLGQSHSLKEKRMVIRRARDQVRERLGIFVAEVGALDTWQRAELGVAVPSGDKVRALAVLDDVVQVIAAAAGAGAIVAIAKTAIAFTDESVPVALSVTDEDRKLFGPENLERTGAGDKVVAADGWVPPEWQHGEHGGHDD